MVRDCVTANLISDFVTLSLMEARETITLDAQAQHRLSVLTGVIGAVLTAEEAGRILRLSTR